MSERQGWKTADELMDELEQKPEFVERQRQRMAQREENRRRYAEAAAGMLEELESIGFSVETLAQLRQRGVGDKSAVPVLVEWLPKIDYLPLKRDLIATLGSPWARPEAARPLIEEFRRVDPADDSTNTHIRWSIGDALERVADESVLDDVVEIATDDSHGLHRALVVAAVGNMRKAREKALSVLVELLDDEVVAPYAVMGLGKLRSAEACSFVERFLDHPEAWVRKEAKKALARIVCRRVGGDTVGADGRRDQVSP